jgi:GNAT superfamily N-acetyltransferase
MLYTNLEKAPNFVQKTVDLIEKSFGYTSENSFQIDFYPLLKNSNHKNCHIIIENDEVIAHIGVLERRLEIKNKLHTIYMYGGIAVSDSFRGKGLFKKLFNSLENQYKDCALHLLWSEKLDLYNKFNFHPCIGLYEYKKESFEHSFNVVETKFKDIDQSTLNRVKELYINNEIRIKRFDDDWNEVKQITSADLFLIYKDEELVNYFVMNKGADLTGIIHEYGSIDKKYLVVMRNYGTVWCSLNIDSSSAPLYAALAHAGESNLFSSFIKDITDFDLVNLGRDDIHFKNKNDSYHQSISDFLIGIFGPGKYKEVQDTQSINISGLDSI